MKKADYLGSRALKGAMAVVLAVGLCPVTPAMAQEGATTSGEGGAESSSVEAPVDDAATSIDEAGAEENGAAQIEGASSANTSSPIDAASAVLPGESDQGSEWQSWGDCEWAVDADGCLTIRPKGGADFGALPDSFDSAVAPWCDDGCRQDIKSVYVSKGVKASRYSRGLFAQLSSAESMDVSNLDVSSAIDLGCMFELCSSLTSLNVSGWDTSAAKNMEVLVGVARYLLVRCFGIDKDDLYIRSLF